MSTIPENPPDPAAAADSVTAYLAFITDHDPDPSSWTDGEIRGYSAFAARVAQRVREASAGTWTCVDKDGEEHRFPTALAAALWLEHNPAVAA